MFQWQLVVLFMLLLTTICMSGSPDGDDSKTCLLFIGSAGDAKCSAFCIGKGKKGGSCIKKRCVCNGIKSDEDDNDNSQRRKRRQLSIFKKSE